jgi:hypothetical protein
MPHKKPTPLFYNLAGRRICPVCGTRSYSREGIHPQCAQQRADDERMQRVKKAQESAPPPEPSSNPAALRPWHKRCPRCQAEVHIRKPACDCGHDFTAGPQ